MPNVMAALPNTGGTAVWLCSNAAKKRNPLKFAEVP